MNAAAKSGVEQPGVLAGLITQRSQVQVLLPLFEVSLWKRK